MYSGIVYDVMRQHGMDDWQFLLANNIKPLNPHHTLFGPVFTTCGEIVGRKDYNIVDEIRLNIPKYLKQGQVVMLSANDDYYAHAGDITLDIYKKCGAIGFITDGLVRDSRIILENNIPCFCSNTTPIDAIDNWAIVRFNTPISMPSIVKNKKVFIWPGDYICADNDGIIVIPKKISHQILHKITVELKREDSIRNLLNSDDLNTIYKRYGRW